MSCLAHLVWKPSFLQDLQRDDLSLNPPFPRLLNLRPTEVKRILISEIDRWVNSKQAK